MLRTCPPLVHTRRSRAHILTASATTTHHKGDGVGPDRFSDCFVIPGNSSTKQTGELPWDSTRHSEKQQLRAAQVTDEHALEVGTVVCVHDRQMKEPWCFVASESKVGTRTLIRYDGKRWGIETSFRDIKDMRFGMGLSAMRVSNPQRRNRLFLLSALAMALRSLLGAAGESLGYDRWLKVNTVKYRTHSLFRQGLMLYDPISNWPDERVRPLMERFSEMLMEQRVFREIFGVI